MIDISLHGVEVKEAHITSHMNGVARMSIDDSDPAPVSVFCGSAENARAIGEAFIALAEEMDKAKGEAA